MTMDWGWFVGRLRAYPPGVHRLGAPCDELGIERLRQVALEPLEVVAAMLAAFDGAELFHRCGPMLTVFGVSPVVARDPLEFAPDWYIDKYTPAWRSAMGTDGWALGMMSYGGLVILERGLIREWNIVDNEWIGDEMTVREWAERVLREGDECLAAD